MSVVTRDTRERLEETRSRVRGAREERSLARKMLDAARKANEPQAQAHAQSEVTRLDFEVETAQALESEVLRQMAGVSPSYGPESVFSDPAAMQQLEQLGNSSTPIGSLMLGRLVSQEGLIETLRTGRWGWDNSRNMMAAAGDPVVLPDTSRVGPPLGVVSQLRRRLSLLDLLPVAPMTSGSFVFSQESGSMDTAAETADLSLKPGGEMLLTDVTCHAATVAHWLKTARGMLADLPSLGTSMSDRLVYGVNRRLEAQILGGDGVGQNIRGILNTTGILSQAFSSTEALADLVLDGQVAALTADAEPNGIVMAPATWAAVRKVKASGSGEYLAGDPMGAQTTTLWDLPLVLNRLIPANTALIGDFTQGATLYVREGVNLRVSDSDQDDFLRNRVTMLAEGRFGLAVFRPACFCQVHLA